MADNYLGNKFDEFYDGSGKKTKHRRHSSISLDSLLLKNRSYRGFDKNYIVSINELTEIISVNSKLPSARNQQAIRFKPVLSDDAAKVLSATKWAGALPELHLPLPGTEPNSFIICCTTVPETKWIDVDLGISCQSMLLKAVDIGLNGICIGAFDKEAIKKTFSLIYEPILILAIGKGIETIQLLPISENDNHNYYRKEGIHYVPKVRPDELIIK